MEEFLNRLNKSITILRIISFSTFILLITDLMMLATYLYNLDPYKSQFQYFNFTLSISIIGIFFVVLHSMIRQNAYSYYEEITDEVEWNYSRNNDSVSRFPIEVRVVIKTFLRTSNLPLTTSQNGNIIYFLLFLIFLLLPLIFNVFIK